jgi:hypothetical protein
MINAILARELNWLSRMTRGAIGNTSVRFSREAGEDLTMQEALLLRGLMERSATISILLKEQILAIEDFYLAHGSVSAKATIAKRREIYAKFKTGDFDITEEENAIIAHKKRVSK